LVAHIFRGILVMVTLLTRGMFAIHIPTREKMCQLLLHGDEIVDICAKHPPGRNGDGRCPYPHLIRFLLDCCGYLWVKFILVNKNLSSYSSMRTLFTDSARSSQKQKNNDEPACSSGFSSHKIL